MSSKGESYNIVLAGEAGHGIQSIEGMLVRAAKRAGFHVFAMKEYMSRVRGGINSTSIRVSDLPVQSYSERIDLLVALDGAGIPHLRDRIKPSSLVIGEAGRIAYDGLRDVPLTALAAEAGSPLYANSIVTGLVCGLLGMDWPELDASLREYFASKADEAREGNSRAAAAGYRLGTGMRPELGRTMPSGRNAAAREAILVNGAEAVSLGALAGGCNYVCGYPMSPGTTVLTSMAEYSKGLDLLVEQVEDEVGVINMALGAWYAGARALISTSGGGFALMSEGLSLAGMSETPVVIHLAQRPGPATGLPTRTEQGDLDLVLYAGHGDFPRAILAPGSLAEAFDLARRAMDLADAYQIPVFILTDQYFVDSYGDTEEFRTEGISPSSAVLRTEASYRRYALDGDGISPRGIPGYGEGLVRADSHEHDEDGHLTEDRELRKAMVRKRMRKLARLEDAALPPILIGPEKHDTLIVGWGSTRHAIGEALGRLGREKTAQLHFPQVYPLHRDAKSFLERAKRLVLVEGNVTGQFGELLKRETGIDIADRILKYDGMPFSVEELELGLADSFARAIAPAKEGR
jgi:2-oxoglutarate ferredoxin oxidoreductase subunit alpha